MLVVRGTKKLRDRVKGAPAGDDDVSTTALGDWFATALFWRPQVALLVNARTFIPVFIELAPAAKLLDRVPAAIEAALRAHGVDEAIIATEVEAMTDVRLAPTNDRSVLGVMNEFAFLGEHHQASEPSDLLELSLRLAGTPIGPLHKSTGFPDLELAAVLGDTRPLAEVIPLRPGQPTVAPVSPAAEPEGAIFQLKVTLHDTKPPIWRRVLVDGASTLDDVHEVIQAAFGWWNYHLHEFRIDGVDYGVPDPDEDWGPPITDESTVRVDSVAKNGSKFEYVYDFGDDWRHKIVVEKVTPADGTPAVPACVDGRRACPPEDCGGTWGYKELLEILADPRHPEHADKLEWIGRPYDPEAFDASEFDENLRNQKLAAFDDWP